MRDIGFGSRVICAVIATMTGLGPLTPYAARAQDFQGRMGSAERAQIQTVEQTSLEDAPLPDAEEIAPVEDLSAEAPVDEVTPTPRRGGGGRLDAAVAPWRRHAHVGQPSGHLAADR